MNWVVRKLSFFRLWLGIVFINFLEFLGFCSFVKVFRYRDKMMVIGSYREYVEKVCYVCGIFGIRKR